MDLGQPLSSGCNVIDPLRVDLGLLVKEEDMKEEEYGHMVACPDEEEEKPSVELHCKTETDETPTVAEIEVKIEEDDKQAHDNLLGRTCAESNDSHMQENGDMSLSALQAASLALGRKRRLDVWVHFNYDAAQRNTTCNVMKEDGDMPCGFKLSGKNTTNLKRHLKAHHPDLFASIPEKTPHKEQPSGKRTQSLITAAFSSTSKHKPSSSEQDAKEKAIARWIGRCGLPARLVEDEDFVHMLEALDKKITLPKKTRINNLIEKMYSDEKQKLKEQLATVRRITIGLAIWTKRGLTASFLAISACYFCTEENKARHVLLRLDRISHPHTAECVKTSVYKCTEDWGIPKHKILTVITDNGIPKHKILTVITDNGSNAVVAFQNEQSDSNSSDESEERDEDSGIIDEQRYGTMATTPCVVHTLHLVVNMIHKEASIRQLLDRAHVQVRLFHKSSVATEHLLELCGLTLIKDCPTRWSSTFLTISRLLQVKDSLVQVADRLGWDCLLPSEWERLTALRNLLLPFAEHTQMLQSDTMSLSLVVPALLDLNAHLSEFPHTEASGYRDLASLAQMMKADMKQRFGCFLDPGDSKFSPLAAAACFLNPSVSPDALTENQELQELSKRAEDYIAQMASPLQEEQCDDNEQGGDSSTEGEEATAKRPRFRFLLKTRARPSRRNRSKLSVRQEIWNFKEQLSGPIDEDSAFEFWAAQGSAYQILKPLALDLLAMPASQAFSERVFSITGDLSHGCGRRNRARLILERAAFLKLNGQA
ncbi:zinc finger BED domain-containing protein 4-like isoform X1 [Alosa sapidissima]|uniref:zinc finger BED domain-containing protein 4-like isoform X1 n=1 Tax=Alosa sapidissima TaxID=34773 RepID=UPI001C0A0190|nr:zinc finger BED domain-containing protein 4-like isoform X1 [Alosa sapidissima]XP_041960098.1 zinc finger BED domain-containing protein 4-like isoform X1 [Alosa sapidissima]